MAGKLSYEQLEQKAKQLEKEIQDRKGIEDALKDYNSYKSVLAALRGVGLEQSEEMLFQTFLSEIVKQYGFCMSWYGQYSSGEIRPILSAGRVDRYLDNLVLEIREPTSPDAQCAMSQAILTEASFTYADLERDEGFRQWRDYALELGYRSNLALPLKVDGQVEGGVMVYADTPNAFPKERIERLQLLMFEISAILAGRRSMQKAAEALRKSEQTYRTLVETSHDIIFAVDLRGNFQFTNKAFESILGFSDKERKKINGFDLVHPEDLNRVKKRFAGLIEGRTEDNMEYRYRSKDGSYIHVLTNASPIFDSQGNVVAAFGIARDISKRKEAEEAIRKARDELEQRVEERTADLVKANEQLKGEIDERKRAEEALQKREAELGVQSHHLAEVNNALKVLLKQREEDKKELEENVLSNVKQLVSSHLDRLKESRLDANQTTLVSILESNLSNIVSPFISRLSSKFLHLTPMEIRVADLIKEGKTNKEIGALLSLSPNTVKFHRYNLRSKLGLKNKKMNLRTHLLSLAK